MSNKIQRSVRNIDPNDNNKCFINHSNVYNKINSNKLDVISFLNAT